jgi:hypothetical protein
VKKAREAYKLMVKRSRYRRHVIEELIKTEEAYVRDLTTI